MAFKTEGQIEVTVVEAGVQDCRFPPKPNEVNNIGELVQCWYDIALLVQDAQGNNDFWLGELSTRRGVGNSADKYRYDLTLATLRDIGFNVNTIQELEQQFQPAADRTICIPNLVGIRCKAVTENRTYKKYDGTEGHVIGIKYLNRLNSGNGGKKLNFDEFMAARRGVAPAPAAAPAPAQAAPALAPAAAPGYPPPAYQQPPQGYAQQPQAYPVASGAPVPPPPPAPAPAAPAAAPAPAPACPY